MAFQAHALRYLECYLPSSGIEFALTMRYKHSPSVPLRSRRHVAIEYLAALDAAPANSHPTPHHDHGNIPLTDGTSQINRRMSLFFSPPDAAKEPPDSPSTSLLAKADMCVLATRDYRPGEIIYACKGGITDLSKEEDEALREEAAHHRSLKHSLPDEVADEASPPPPTSSKRFRYRGVLGAGRDFSVIRSARKGCSQLFLGPARFVNHDCEPNVEFYRMGSQMAFRCIKHIRINEEIVTYYGDNYFEVDNAECLCATCEARQQGAFTPASLATSEVDGAMGALSSTVGRSRASSASANPPPREEEGEEQEQRSIAERALRRHAAQKPPPVSILSEFFDLQQVKYSESNCDTKDGHVTRKMLDEPQQLLDSAGGGNQGPECECYTCGLHFWSRDLWAEEENPECSRCERHYKLFRVDWPNRQPPPREESPANKPEGQRSPGLEVGPKSNRNSLRRATQTVNPGPDIVLVPPEGGQWYCYEDRKELPPLSWRERRGLHATSHDSHNSPEKEGTPVVLTPLRASENSDYMLDPVVQQRRMSLRSHSSLRRSTSEASSTTTSHSSSSRREKISSSTSAAQRRKSGSDPKSSSGSKRQPSRHSGTHTVPARVTRASTRISAPPNLRTRSRRSSVESTGQGRGPPDPQFSEKDSALPGLESRSSPHSAPRDSVGHSEQNHDSCAPESRAMEEEGEDLMCIGRSAATQSVSLLKRTPEQFFEPMQDLAPELAPDTDVSLSILGPLLPSAKEETESGGEASESPSTSKRISTTESTLTQPTPDQVPDPSFDPDVPSFGPRASQTLGEVKGPRMLGKHATTDALAMHWGTSSNRRFRSRASHPPQPPQALLTHALSPTHRLPSSRMEDSSTGESTKKSRISSQVQASTAAQAPKRSKRLSSAVSGPDVKRPRRDSSEPSAARSPDPSPANIRSDTVRESRNRKQPSTVPGELDSEEKRSEGGSDLAFDEGTPAARQDRPPIATQGAERTSDKNLALAWTAGIGSKRARKPVQSDPVALASSPKGSAVTGTSKRDRGNTASPARFSSAYNSTPGRVPSTFARLTRSQSRDVSATGMSIGRWVSATKRSEERSTSTERLTGLGGQPSNTPAVPVTPTAPTGQRARSHRTSPTPRVARAPSETLIKAESPSQMLVTPNESLWSAPSPAPASPASVGSEGSSSLPASARPSGRRNLRWGKGKLSFNRLPPAQQLACPPEVAASARAMVRVGHKKSDSSEPQQEGTTVNTQESKPS